MTLKETGSCTWSHTRSTMWVNRAKMMRIVTMDLTWTVMMRMAKKGSKNQIVTKMRVSNKMVMILLKRRRRNSELI